MTKTTVLKIPANLYIANPEIQIRAMLGNDTEIISYKRSNFLNNNREYLIAVEYKNIDYNPFSIYRVKTIKQQSSGSNKFIATLENIKDTSETLNCIVSKLNIGDYVEIMVNPIANDEFKYLGIKKDKFNHGFCTIFGNEHLTYHGSKIPKPDIKDFSKVKKGDIDLQVTMSKDNYTYNHFELAFFTKNLTYEDIEYSKCSPDELIELLCEKKEGFYILNNYHILYYPNKDYKILKETVEYLVYTLMLDYENYLILNK